jgi:hypothetical protein
VSLTEYFFSFLDGSVVELLEGEDEEDGLPLLLVGEYLERSFLFSLALIRVLVLIVLPLSFCSKWVSSLSSTGTQAPISPTMM